MSAHMTFRQNGQYYGIFQIVPFLALCDDVIEELPHPKLNGYQRPIPGGAFGAKGLGMFVQTLVNEVILKMIPR